ncbi:MAG: cyclase family protein [Proteobacteria bacterium]|nr:cyclase family protein [Pseudomonadota bacterium]
MHSTISLKDFTFIDLTHALVLETPSWNGSCGFEHTLRDDYDPSAPYQFRTYDIHMQAGIGTHMDAPSHCYPGGRSITDLNLNECITPCVVINVSPQSHERYSLSRQDLETFEAQHGDIPPGCFVIVYTGWDQHWNDPEKYRNNHVFPSISKEAASLLLERQIVGLGIDTLSPDRPEDGFPVHQLILSAGKFIVENVANASQLPPIGAYSLALPIKIQGGTEAPLRLVGVVKK